MKENIFLYFVATNVCPTNNFETKDINSSSSVKGKMKVLNRTNVTSQKKAHRLTMN